MQKPSAQGIGRELPLRRVWLLDLGVESYDQVHDLQLELVDLRYRGLIDDVLILVEHEPVITLGQRADEANILVSPEVLAKRGVQVRRIERGGDATYHGPGQLVGYPILRLRDYCLGASDYMHRLEDTVAGVVEEYGLGTQRREKIIGVWVGDNKICALGVRIRRGVTFHGFALNVASNRQHWGLITPCGITDGGVTSLEIELTGAPAMREVRARVAAHFAVRFSVDLTPTTVSHLRDSASVLSVVASPE